MLKSMPLQSQYELRRYFPLTAEKSVGMFCSSFARSLHSKLKSMDSGYSQWIACSDSFDQFQEGGVETPDRMLREKCYRCREALFQGVYSVI